jgi:uncharacterized protein (TIGR02996 family)
MTVEGADVRESRALAKILANPDDNAPRLAYAAWLDRHGDPILAEFIRVQIEEEKVSFLQRSDRGYQLWQVHRKEWELPVRTALGLPARCPGRVFLQFTRGFVDTIRALGRDRAALVVDRAETLFTLAPIQELILWGQWDREPDPYGDCPQIYDPFGQDTLRELVRKPCFSSLRSLDLGGNRIGDEGAELLLSAEHLGPSCKLDVSNNDISSGMIAKLRTRYQLRYYG